MKYTLTFLLLIIANTLLAQENKISDFSIVDKPPLAKGCKSNMDNDTLIACFKKSIGNHIASKINFSIIQNQKLDKGNYRIDTYFIVDKKGKVRNIEVNFDNKPIVREIISVFKSIKRMTPAYMKEKPVGVSYVIPIKFKIK